MTTHMKVSAHCASTKAVEIVITDGATVNVVIIEDRQTWESAVYDGKTVAVREFVKPTV